MNVPRFNAEASLFHQTAGHSGWLGTPERTTDQIVPQLIKVCSGNECSDKEGRSACCKIPNCCSFDFQGFPRCLKCE
jgi:hypothetical protein